ncbi:MAG: hypothetical protein ACTSQE_12435 [Candidatus Heimdallarchaeaceae archaeon]
MSFVKEINVPHKNKLSAESKRKASTLIEEKRKEDSKLVKGIFKNLEAPGSDVEFPYRAYKGDPIRVYTLEDGESYTIPLGVAKHINNQCTYKRHKHLVDKDGKHNLAWDKSIERYQFVSTDFM